MYARLTENPYGRSSTRRPPPPPAPPPDEETTRATTTTEMGCQSQRRNNLNDRGRPNTNKKTNKRKHSSTKEQTTLAGDLAFNALKDCKICVAEFRNLKKSKDAHDPLCKRNTSTRGLTGQALIDYQNGEALMKIMSPLSEKEKGDGRHTAKDGEVFFCARDTTKTKSKQQQQKQSFKRKDKPINQASY